MSVIDTPQSTQIGDFACEIEEGENAVARATLAWETIEKADGVPTPFQSLTVARCSAQVHLAQGEQPRIVTVREHGRPLVVLPTVVGRQFGVSTVRFLGDPLIQYGDAIVSREALPIHIEAACWAAGDPRVGSALTLRKVRVDSPIAAVLERLAKTTLKECAPFVNLGTARNSHPRRAREIRRLRRRLSECGDLKFDVMCSAGDVAEVLRETLALKRAWLVERGLPSAVLGTPMWEDVLFDLNRADLVCARMIAARLAVNGETAATEIGFASANTWFAYIGALAPRFARFGPGHVMMEEIMAWCCNNGRSTYDLLSPSQAYKHALATGSVAVKDYVITNDLQGRMVAATAGLVPIAKKLIELSPVRLRRQLVRLYLGTAEQNLPSGQK